MAGAAPRECWFHRERCTTVTRSAGTNTTAGAVVQDSIMRQSMGRNNSTACQSGVVKWTEQVQDMHYSTRHNNVNTLPVILFLLPLGTIGRGITCCCARTCIPFCEVLLR